MRCYAKFVIISAISRSVFLIHVFIICFFFYYVCMTTLLDGSIFAIWSNQLFSVCFFFLQTIRKMMWNEFIDIDILNWNDDIRNIDIEWLIRYWTFLEWNTLRKNYFERKIDSRINCDRIYLTSIIRFEYIINTRIEIAKFFYLC